MTTNRYRQVCAHVRGPRAVVRRVPSGRVLPAAAALAGAVLLGTGWTYAASPEELCAKVRYDAAAKYAKCQQKQAGKVFSGAIDFPTYQAASGACMRRYTAIWPRLQNKVAGTGATCDALRFVDNGNGTVTDGLTGLQWEQKTDDATIHDKDNMYAWTAGGEAFSAAEGTLFTSFLSTLNGGTCFAGQCDWRMPSQAELQTILLQPFPCGATPCIDPAFGPTAGAPFGDPYWSGPGFGGHLGGNAVVTLFADGNIQVYGKSNNFSARAVRGGL
jgi:hypothetical protein